MYRPLKGLFGTLAALAVPSKKPTPIVPPPLPLEAPGMRKRRGRKNKRAPSLRVSNRRKAIAKESRRINSRLGRGMGL